MTQAQSTKKEDILKAALDLLVRYDIQATAMSRIAKHANVGMGTIYNYFESKEVLLYELFRSLKTRLAEAIFATYPENGSFQERFFHVWRTLCRYYISHPQEFLFGERYAASPYMSKEMQQEAADFWVRLNIMFEEARSQQVIKDIQLEYFLPMVHGALSAVVRNHIQGSVLLDDDAIEMVINSFWDSIKYQA